ncbi:MAG: small GTP-binding protein [Promethearchaeota archaeon CR_4]|nr:MAG: small GTP-binding protein [Candidatus Lokiarchaeota archaeon CR_4]
MSIDRQKFDALLKWFIKIAPKVDAVVIVDRQGLTIASESKTKIDEDVIGGVSAVVEQVLTRITKEFKSGQFGTGSFDTEKCRLIFVETGKQAILVTIADALASIDELYPYVYVMAEKVARILDGRPVSPVIPQIVGASSDTLVEKGKLVKIEPASGSYAYKVVLGGEGGVGKTSLAYSFIEGKFETDYKSTIGTSIMKKELTIRGSDAKVRFIIWDLAGQDQFKRVRQTYYQNAEAGIIVFDVTRRDTFLTVEKWVVETRQGSGKPDIRLIIVGNKIDLPNRQVTYEEGIALGKKLNLSYIETSAKTGDMVNDAFEMLALSLFKTLSLTSL